MKKFTLMAGLLLPLAMMGQTLPKGVTSLTGNNVTVTSEDDRAGIKKNPFVIADGKLFFTAKTDADGDELWMTDGTVDGTKMVKDINAGSGSSTPRFLVEMDGKVYFQATDGTNGIELWVSDGTSGGTTMVKDLYTGSNSSAPEMLTPLNGNLLFSAASAASEVDEQKWLYLYKPGDGSVTLVKSGVQASNTGDCNYRYIVANESKGVAYFQGQTKGHNDEIWVTDGTDAGTHAVKEICPDALGSSNIQWLTCFNDSAIFWREKTPRGYANAYGGDSTLYASHLDQQVWVSDGTEEGTHMLKFIDKNVDATSGEGTNTQAAWPFFYNDQVYFRTDDGSHGVEVWVSDLSTDTSKTKLFRDINPGEWPSWAEDWAVYKGMLCFDADAGGSSYGAEPSWTDGTFGTVNMLADLQPGNAGSWSSRFEVVQIDGKDSLLYGVGGQPNIGSELWMVKDFTSGAIGIDMGPGDSRPFNLTSFSNSLFFTTTTVSSLFKLNYIPAPIVKFKNQVKFDSTNVKTALPLVVQKENLDAFLDPELEFYSNDERFVLMSTDKETYDRGAILSSNAVDTIWIKLKPLNPDSSFRNFVLSTTVIDKSDNSESTVTSTVVSQVEPVLRGDLLYLVEAGKKDPTVIEAGEKMGKSQSTVDQAFGADPVTGKNWGYENCGWAKDDGADKWGGLRQMDDTKAFRYKFEVENGDYVVQIGFTEFWGGRSEHVLVNGTSLEDVILTASDNKMMRTAKVTVSDGMITIEVTQIADNAIITWVKIGQVVEGVSCFDPVCEQRDLEYQQSLPVVDHTADLTNSFEIYPNPSNGHVNLNVLQGVFSTYEVYGFDGKMVMKNQIKPGQTKFSFDLNQSGLYIVKLIGQTENAATKLLIK
jgi:ELWxxDGT repeat protein